jgi:signal peptidase
VKSFKFFKQKLLVILMLLMWLIIFIQGGLALRNFCARYRLFRVASGSMEPTLPTGTIIAVEKCTDTLFAPGDIITFKQNDLLITHRVIDFGYKEGFYYLTQGDANQTPDAEPVKHQAVIGKVVFVAPAMLARFLSLLTVRRLVLFHALLLLFLAYKKRRKTRLFTHSNLRT